MVRRLRCGVPVPTLTPFGFQQEDRPFWQCVDTYVQMSPFAHADKVTAPLLLIHGMEDKNTGTAAPPGRPSSSFWQRNTGPFLETEH